MKDDIETIKTDVLIIGAGGAGCRAAIASSEEDVCVLMVTKNPITRAGITPVGFTGISANIGQDHNDSSDVHFEDVVKAGRYLGDQNLVKVMVSNASERVHDLVKYGINMRREKGKFVQLRTPGQTYPRMLRIIGGGHGLVMGLKKEIERHNNIKVIEDVIITKLLLSSQNRINGAFGLQLRKGKFLAIESKSLVLTTGGAEQLWLHNDCPPESTGDGYALCYRVGGELIDMEQQLFYPTVALYPETIYGLEISYEWCFHYKLGGWLINAKGERFFPPEQLPTRDISSRMISDEINSGRGTEHHGVYLDITKCDEARREELATMQHCNKRLLELGIDLRKQVIEVAPGAHTTLGGIRINEKAQTSINGLFAAGECSGNVHGANRIAGHSYLETQAFGFIAGKNAANFAKENSQDPIDRVEISKECERVNGFLSEKKHTIKPNELRNKIKGIVSRYIGNRRNEDGLENAIRQIRLLKEEEFPRLGVVNIREYNNDWIEAIEVSNMLDVAEIVANCALLRRESRGTHFREDYPEINNKNWLKHTLVKLENEKLLLGTKPVVMSKFRPLED